MTAPKPIADPVAALAAIPRYTGRGATGDADKDDLLATRLELLDIIAAHEATIARLRKIEDAARASHPPNEIACDDARLHAALAGG